MLAAMTRAAVPEELALGVPFQKRGPNWATVMAATAAMRNQKWARDDMAFRSVRGGRLDPKHGSCRSGKYAPHPKKWTRRHDLCVTFPTLRRTHDTPRATLPWRTAAPEERTQESVGRLRRDRVADIVLEGTAAACGGWLACGSRRRGSAGGLSVRMSLGHGRGHGALVVQRGAAGG